jgi:glycosyltransferase involved in cell wall biosynthesis
LSSIHLSVVIPAYNEAARVPSTLPQVLRFLDARPDSYEVVVVDNGSTDNTASLVEELIRNQPRARLLRCPVNHGKGAAVRAGMLNARGEFVVFTDADLSAPIAEIDRLLDPLRNGYDVVLGSRALQPEWTHTPWFRRVAGRVFNRFLWLVTGLPFRDTQCGFKAFRREAARRLFALQTIEGFGFDPEILYLAGKLGCRTLEVPVHWVHNEKTKVRLLRDGARMACDLLRIRWNDWTGKYSAAAKQVPVP